QSGAPDRVSGAKPQAALLPAIQLAKHLTDAAVEQRHHLIDLFRGADQRRPHRQPVRVEAREQTVLQRPPADANAYGGIIAEPLLRLQVAYELDALKQPLAANVADDAVLRRQPLEVLAQAFAQLAGVEAKVALQDLLQHGQAGGAGYGIALESV